MTSSKKESALVWAPLRKAIKDRDLHYVRIENSAEMGTPDLVVHARNKAFWIEMKEGKLKHDILTVGLSAEQYVWLHHAVNHSVPCAVVCRVKRDWYFWTEDRDFWKLKTPGRVDAVTFGRKAYPSAGQVLEAIFDSFSLSFRNSAESE